MSSERSWRLEHDLLGDRQVPSDAYYGIQTLRAVENFAITGLCLRDYPSLVRSLAMVKKAAVRANGRLGLIDPARAEAIEKACDDIIDLRLLDQFVVDMIQGGAGTSTNMNANEVIANRALELLGKARGSYAHLHPINHVNLSQSTNDAYPTAVRLGVLLECLPLAEAIRTLCDALGHKAAEFDDVLKVGRTQLQDAVPMTLGQEFRAFQVTLAEDIARIEEACRHLREVNLGATAIGTGINADPGFAGIAVQELADISGIDFVSAADLVEATSDTGAFVLFSAALKRYAIKLSKVCNDLRLLNSGPRAGFGEIDLPAVQPGSSIMPGKINPVIPEAVNQVAYQVIGNDLAVTMAAEAGQLQLNAMEPVIAFNVLRSMQMLRDASRLLAEKCISGISANREKCRDLVDRSLCTVAALNPHIGYDRASEIAKRALQTGRGVAELVLEEQLLTPGQLAQILEPRRVSGTGA